jgi:twitching motility protein PilT
MTSVNSEAMPTHPLEVAKRVGVRLIDRGLITAPELERASKAAAERKVDLGDALISMGLLTEDQVGAVVAEEFAVPYVFPHAGSIDRELLAHFPSELLLRHKAIPFARDEDRITLATSEVSTLAAGSQFEAAAGARIGFSFASRRRVERALRALLGSGPEKSVPDDARSLDDPSAVGLFYGHLTRAVSEGAAELRFEPTDGAVAVRYRVGGRLEDRGREPLSALVSVVARARVLIGLCRNAKPYDLFGTLLVPLAGKDTTLDVAITPTRTGESVIVRLTRQGTTSVPLTERSRVSAETSLQPQASAQSRLDMPTLLLFTKEAGGSDLHLSAGATTMVRVHGEMRKLTLPGGGEAPPFSPDEIRLLIFDLLTDTQKSRLEADKELDFSLTIGKDTRFRGNIFFQERGLGAVFRVIPTQIKSCDELGLPPVIKGLCELEKGLVLCTGPTGSGKSTTLAALVDLINSTRRGHILTVEDPIEFVHKPKMCMVNQREVGPNTHSFAKALRSALREDPDVILVGEMRDLETMALAITAAETGHLVFGTLHTSSAAKTVDRIINVFPAGEQAQIRAMLAESIQAVIAQVLLTRRGGKGRVAAQEILVASTGVRALIREGKTYQIPSSIQTGGKYGMQSLEQALTKLSVNGVIDAGEAERQLAALGLSREDAAAEKLQALTGGTTTRMAAPPPTGVRPGLRNP